MRYMKYIYNFFAGNQSWVFVGTRQSIRKTTNTRCENKGIYNSMPQQLKSSKLIACMQLMTKQVNRFTVHIINLTLLNKCLIKI